MFGKFRLAIAASLALLTAAVPAAAQQFSDGFTFLKAVKERDGDKAEGMLTGSGARIVNTKDITSGEGALHILARDRDLNWLRFMLAKGARPDIQNKDGETPLLLATQLGWSDGADALLRFGAKVDQANSRGETPLIMAVHKRDIVMIRLLLERGADPRRADRIAGYSAIDYAKQDSRSSAIAKLLEQAGPPKQAAGPPR